MKNLQDCAQTIIEQFGVDPKEGMTPNAAQSLLISESELGSVSNEEMDRSIQQ